MKKTPITIVTSIIVMAMSISAFVAPDAQVVGHGLRADGYSLTVAAHSDDASADGTATVVDTESRSRVRVEITSIVIKEKDTVATLTGVVTSSTGVFELSVPEGTEVSFAVVDNDENGLPDQFGFGAGFPIKGGKDTSITRGNFQVRGEPKIIDGEIPMDGE